jgi:hypothetical protein
MLFWVWIVVCFVFASLVAYRLAWLKAIGRPIPGDDNRRVRGRVAALDPDAEPGWLELRRQAETVQVFVGEETRLPRWLRPGRRVTVDGLRSHRVVDRLYRQPSACLVLEAFRIAPGWPELRWLRPPALLSGLVVVGMLPLFLSTESAFSRTRASLLCPAGTIVASSETTPFGFAHWCRKTTGGHRHGPWTSWTEQGRLLEWGSYRDGLKHGRFTTWYRSGRRRRTVDFADGEKHGLVTEWRDVDRHPLHRRRSYWRDRPHGHFMLWDEKGRLLDKQSFFDGWPHGRFLQWHDCAEKHHRTWRSAPFVFDIKWDDIPCRPKSRRWRVERTYWHGVQHGSQREWDARGKLLESGYYWAGKRIGVQRPGGTQTYVHGRPIDSLPRDRRMAALLETQKQLRVETERALARWRKSVSKPPLPTPRHQKPPRAPGRDRSIIWLDGGCGGSGFGDRRGKQGTWKFPHNLGVEVIYLDGEPVLGCHMGWKIPPGLRWRQPKEICTWLDRRNALAWWRELDTCPLQVQTELGILSLRPLDFSKRSDSYSGCASIGRLKAGRGGEIDVKIRVIRPASNPKQRERLRARFARCYVRALQRHPKLPAKLDLNVKQLPPALRGCAGRGVEWVELSVRRGHHH